MRFSTPFPSRSLWLALAVSTAALMSATPSRAAPPATTFTCTNLSSGANWKISIDFARSTVDDNPARISTATIEWHDRVQGGNYSLDRKSGNLTVTVASSTGGYFLYDRCRAT
jgi:hypothetical protein